MKKIFYINFLFLCISLVGNNIIAQNTIPPPTLDCHVSNGGDIQLGGIDIPNITLKNQDNQEVLFADLVRGKVVVMNFIFTTCTTICPPMGANFTHLKQRLGPAIEKEDVVMISVSIDPVTDTPERLRNWQNRFNNTEDWTLLTGEKAQVDALLKGLKVFTALKESHAPILLIGKEGEAGWMRTNALAAPEKLEQHIKTYLDRKEEVGKVMEMSAEQKYFSDVKLINQYGEKMRLYSDLMKDKIVVISPFFLRCTGACPVMNTMMKDLQIHFGDRVGKDIALLSISVDPEFDTPDKVAAYAKSMDAIPGRYYLTGSKENVQQALHKLGNGVSSPEDHKNIIMIGNVATRLWKKANGLSTSADIIAIVESVIQDVE